MSNRRSNKSNSSTKSSNGRNKYSSKKVHVKDTDEFCKEDAKIAKSMNDPSWYASHPQLLVDAASIPFNTPVGNKLMKNSPYLGMNSKLIDGKTIGTEISADSGNYIPGIWSMNIVIGPGHSVDNNSPINVAARNIYSYVRYANSGHANYDSPDLMQYLLAMDSIYSYYAFLQRLYGVMNVYSSMNRYIPEALVRSMGVDFDDIMMNLANLRFYINQLAIKINSLYAPATMPIMIRHAWLFSNVFMDSDNSRAQLYVFNPEGFYFYDETLEKGQLQFKFFKTGSPKTFADIVEYGNTLVNTIALSESFGIMGGDIKKAYTSLMSVSLVPENYSVVPVYNPEVLTQIEHAFSVVSTNIVALSLKDMDITSDPNTNALIYNPYIAAGKVRKGFLGDKIINFHQDVVTPSDVMVATRLLPTFDTEVSGEDTNTVTFDEFGTEICTGHQIWTFADKVDGVKTLCFMRFPSILHVGGAGTSTSTEDVRTLQLITQFNHHPIIYLKVEGNPNITSDVYNLGTFAQLDNVTTVDSTTLSKMHATAVLSEFGVPIANNPSGSTIK